MGDCNEFLFFEYCKLDKAAKILKCEISDIIHLGIVQNIELCSKLNYVRGALFIPTAIIPFTDVIKEHPLGAKADLGGASYCSFSPTSHHNCSPSIIRRECEIGTFVEGFANGLWSVNADAINDIESGECVQNMYFTYGICGSVTVDFLTVQFLPDNTYLNVKASMFDDGEFDDNPLPINLSLDNLWITKEEIQKIERISSNIKTEINYSENEYLEVIGSMIHALKNTSISGKKWTQDALKQEMIESGITLKPRTIDDYFSSANKFF